MNKLTALTSRNYVPLMEFLLGLIASCVVAQLLQAIVEIPFLPAFER